jgi:hypothetical protein
MTVLDQPWLVHLISAKPVSAEADMRLSEQLGSMRVCAAGTKQPHTQYIAIGC